jgi:HAMP domain-containing protein
MTAVQSKMPKLIVVMAFDRDEQGELKPAFGAMEQQSEHRAIRTAKALAAKHAA